jgi:hypothetical protein
MYTSIQKKEIREEFWLRFKTYSNLRKLKNNKPGKWIMKETGIKQLNLKFYFDEHIAFAGIEVETRNLDKRIVLYDKLEKLQKILVNKVPQKLIWELEAKIIEKPETSLIYALLTGVSIYNKESWQKVFSFFYETMDPIEEVFLEYSDYLKYSE